MEGFREYAEYGFSVIPLRRGDASKKPAVEWKKYQDEYPSDLELIRWDAGSYNIGIVTGRLSNVVVVDIDGEAGIETLKRFGGFPSNIPRVKTAKGWHFYFAYPEGLDFELRGFAGKTISGEVLEGIDLRAEGNYITAPPSVHASGHKYYWDRDLIFPLPDFAKYAGWIIERQKPKVWQKAVIHTNSLEINHAYVKAAYENEIDKLRSAGQGGRNDALNRCAFALARFIGQGINENDLRHRLLNTALEMGLGHKEAERTIESGIQGGLDNPAEIPAVKGWKNDFIENEIVEMDEAYHAMIDSWQNVPRVESKTYQPIENDLFDAPGLVGKITRWICETAMYPQPILALGAAIAAVGVIKGKRLMNETNLRTNMLVLGIAPSGSGKEHARNCIKALFEEVDVLHLFRGEPQSGNALVALMKDNQGRALLMMDEMGRFLEAVNNKNAGSHQKQIPTRIMNIYNAAGSTFEGLEYVDNAKNMGDSKLDQPCLCIYGTTVPSNFYSSLSSGEAIDGFLARWLVFESDLWHEKPVRKLGRLQPPREIVESLININNISERAGAEINDISGKCRPITIPYNPSAESLIDNFSIGCKQKAKKEYDIKSGLDAIWHRTAEHARKLALVAEDGKEISAETMLWACRLAENRSEYLINAIREHISENDAEKSHKRLLKLIKDAGKSGLPLAAITQKTRWIRNGNERVDMLNTLIQGGDIEQKEITTGGKPKKIFIAR